MKFIKVLTMAFVFSVIGISDSFAGWFWTPHMVDCTATNTITIDLGGNATIIHKEEWEGVKKVCRDGDNWCWSSDCA